MVLGFVVRITTRASYKMYSGVKMRKNGDWYAFYNDIVEGSKLDQITNVGPFETSVAAARRWDTLCYGSEKDVVRFIQHSSSEQTELSRKVLDAGRGASKPQLLQSRAEEERSVGSSDSEEGSRVRHPCEKRVRLGPRSDRSKPLSLRETMKILRGEGALNIRVLNLHNHSTLGNWMLFVTGSSLSHEKRIGDTIVHYVCSLACFNSSCESGS